ncbi:uncharacterized protein LOC120152165 [Hibiscus syriacus]|uniref:uncharacterized protein LOC120152165 n=1 Tax=Hibiscus syriacus TaxID=106335 RepID=UPI0019219054|nr:uncharacterized protein LOC120152165 [Hibiscus syriacus]
METKEEAEENEDNPPLPPWELNHLLEEEEKEGVKDKVDGEAQNLKQSRISDPSRLPPLGHRRTQSEVLAAGHRRNNNFLRMKTYMQKALRWGGVPKDGKYQSSFNPEVLANQKRQWYQLHSKTKEKLIYEQPTSVFEHFIIAGIHPDTDLGSVAETTAKRKNWETDMKSSGMIDLKMIKSHGPPAPIFEPKILFRYPPGKRLSMRLKDLASFCFPGGVEVGNGIDSSKFGLSMALSFVVYMKSVEVAGNATVYGVCLHVPELVKRQPGNFVGASLLSEISGARSQFLVSAPRCYCLLTRVPFFELHYEMLNSIIAQERLNRITEVVSEMNPSLNDNALSFSKQDDQTNNNTIADNPDNKYVNDWMASAMPSNSTVILGDATANDEVSSASLKIGSPLSPESVTSSEALERVLYIDDNVSEASENRISASERINGNFENGQNSSDIGSVVSLRSCTSTQSLFSPARSLASEDNDEDDDLFWNNEKECGDDSILEWAKENKNDLLQIVFGYHALALPPRGSEIVFQPLEHLQAIEYERPPISALALDESYFYSFEAAGINAKLAAAEEALALSVWTTATICRVSLLMILDVLAGVLLEKQVVVVCPNLGVLSAVVLALIPIIRPFQWQSLLLPVLPVTMLDFLDAPVPFLVGVQDKPADLKMKTTSNLVQVNLPKKQVKTCYVPPLPQRKELVSELGPIHSRLSYEGSIAKKHHPTYRCNEAQAEAATQFLAVMREYLESLCENLRSHTITNVQSNDDRVSILLKDSFIHSFPVNDQPFIKLFVDTQLFTVLSDSRLSSYENER